MRRQRLLERKERRKEERDSGMSPQQYIYESISSTKITQCVPTGNKVVMVLMFLPQDVVDFCRAGSRAELPQSSAAQ